MRLIAIVGMTSIFTLIAIDLVGDEATDGQLVAAIIVGSMTGSLVGLGVLNRIGSRPKRTIRARQPAQRVTTPSRPFQDRLDRFTHQETMAEVTQSSFQSKMPFWKAFEFRHRTPPKSSRLIRRILQRIQRFVREQHKR